MTEADDQESRQCPYCAEDIKVAAKKCKHCGELLDPILRESSAPKAPAAPPQARVAPPKARITYVLLGIFLGGLGIHNFYAGYTGRGVAQLLITLLSCGFLVPIVWVWNLIEICVVDTDASGSRMT